ncbi:TIGR00730 family Rossman fold protein [Limnohabitans sp. MORI2]|uniref:LOG family protein n=1 Tax=Limnohabitans sp. MORI2 TaxID=1751150 RepID=UPI0024924909|nr:TIGR00730 family Rossman fold protein [Limnohabitans sp. MORI2]
MDGMLDPHDRRLAEAWETLKAHYDNGDSITPESNRLAFADPEFLLRRETRGLRIQLEMLKPDLAQKEHGIEHTVVVFGSARFRSEEVAHQELIRARATGDEQQIAKAETLVRNARFYEQARALGHTITKFSTLQPEHNKLFICTGGGPGIMEAANRGAQEAGGISVGLNIALPHEQTPNPYITPDLSFKFHYFALRKMHFMMRAKALVAFPGGFGTLDELFETLTLVQCKKSKPVPIVLFGSSYWKRLLHLDVLVEEGVVSEEDLDLFKYVDSVDDAWNFIRSFYEL